MIFTDEEPRTLASITRLKSQLSDLIEPDFGLLDELVGMEVVTRSECDDVCFERTPAQRSVAVLALLATEDKCVKFLRALYQTGQQHVLNFIIEDGGKTGCSYSLSA